MYHGLHYNVGFRALIVRNPRDSKKRQDEVDFFIGKFPKLPAV